MLVLEDNYCMYLLYRSSLTISLPGDIGNLKKMRREERGQFDLFSAAFVYS